ncbi:MAG: 30S ribosomal protein S15 [Nanoarchaeota archaeon]
MTAQSSDWVKIKPADIEKIVIELHKEGKAPAKIGLILRDKHGIPKVKLLGKKVEQILKNASLTPVKEKDAMTKKIEKLKRHILKNKHDYTSKRALTKKLWIVKKL